MRHKLRGNQPVKTMKLLLLSLLLVGAAIAKDYSGYKTIRITPSNSDDIRILKDYERDSPKLDFWQSAGRLDRTVDILVPPELSNEVEELLSDYGLDYRVAIKDLQELIDRQAKEREAVISNSDGFDYNVYHTYEEIREWVYAFGAEHSELIEVFDVAHSYEGRPIAMMKIGNPKSDGSPKKAVYYQGGIHAREWLSPATVINIIRYMVEDYGVDPHVTSLLDTFDYYIIPQYNPDGYVYTWNEDRLWRKNRLPFDDSPCYGVDLNRNYPVGWAGSGASPLRCSYVHYGDGPFSELEHIYVSSYLEDLKNNQDVEFVHFIDFHTYSQLLLGPWSYSASAPNPPEEPEQTKAGEDAAAALKAVGGVDYIVGPSAQTLYEAAGASNDYGYDPVEGLNAKYSYVMELRDTGEYGFVIPDSFIDISGRETYAAVKSFGARILEEFGN